MLRPRRAELRRDEDSLPLVPTESDAESDCEDLLDPERDVELDPKFVAERDDSTVLELTLEFVSLLIRSAVLRTL